MIKRVCFSRRRIRQIDGGWAICVIINVMGIHSRDSPAKHEQIRFWFVGIVMWYFWSGEIICSWHCWYVAGWSFESVSNLLDYFQKILMYISGIYYSEIKETFESLFRKILVARQSLHGNFEYVFINF